MSALAAGDALIRIHDTSGLGFGSGQARIDKHLKLITTAGQNSVWLKRKNKLYNALEELSQIRYECSTPNWDGYESNPITNDTYKIASYIIELIADNYVNLPFPEIIPEPDGDIGFEWNDEDGQTFVFSIDANCMINYAGIFGLRKVHGTEIYTNNIPPAIIYQLNRLNM